jgi:hypothetical protein
MAKKGKGDLSKLLPRIHSRVDDASDDRLSEISTASSSIGTMAIMAKSHF